MYIFSLCSTSFGCGVFSCTACFEDENASIALRRICSHLVSVVMAIIMRIFLVCSVKGFRVMKKFTALFLTLLVLVPVFPAALAAPEGPAVAAKSAVLLEKETGRVLYEQNSHEPLPPASVTKVMSLLLIGEALNSGKITLDETVTCSEHAASMGGSQIYLEPGEKMSVEDMLKSVVLSSANDAVVALGEHIAGSETAFVSMMNERARDLGMADTSFKNACGLDIPGHVTSAYDIALMSRALLLEYPEIKNYTTIWMDSVRGGEFQLANTNKMIRTYTGMSGLKTGYTSTAGHCLSATAERNGMELVCAVLASPSSAERFGAAKSLLDYGFANYALVNIYPNEALAPVPVTLGKIPQVQPEIHESKILLDKELVSKLEKRLEIAENLDAPVGKGQQIGEMIVISGGAEVLCVPIVASADVEKLGFGNVLSKLLRVLFLGGK